MAEGLVLRLSCCQELDLRVRYSETCKGAAKGGGGLQREIILGTLTDCLGVKAQSLTYHRLKFRLRVWVRVMVSTEIKPRAPAAAGLQQGCQGKGWAKDRNHC